MKKRTLATAIAVAMSGPASAITVTGGFSGSWFDEEAPGQGLVLEIIESNAERQGVVYWFTFDSAGNPRWLVGTGPVSDGDITFALDEVQGGVLTPAGFNNDNVTLSPVSYTHLTLPTKRIV